MRNDNGPGRYVRKVQEGTDRYAKRLLVENEELRARSAQLEADRDKLADQARSAEGALEDNAALRAKIASLDAERQLLAGQVARFREQGERQDMRRSELETHLKDIEEENRRFAQEYLKVEQQNADVANLYVASYRLHGTLDRKETIDAIKDIIANLVGSEEMAIFERDADRDVLSLVGAVGVDPEPLREVRIGSGPIGRTATTGQTYIAPSLGGEDGAAAADGLTACIPLLLEGSVTGVIAVFRLLAHKSALEAVDHEIFDLLASQAAMALYCTRLHAARRVRV
jgi:GAF domain-containing protein